ncbi:MAG: RDD family protein [Blastocatellia bacterium]
MPYNAIVTAQAVPANLPAYRQGLDELVIETPERVELYYTRAQVGNRFLAAFIDHLIQLFILAGLALAAYSAKDALDWIWSGLGDWLLAGVILLSFFIYTSYFVIFETIWNGQTPGKRLFRLRVIREDGRPIRFYESLVRNLIRTALDSMPMVIVPLYSIGIVSVFLSGRSKRIGDYVAGTVVIRESETKAPTLSDVMALARSESAKDRAVIADAQLFAFDPEKLGQEDFEAMSVYLRRRYDLPDDVRFALGNRIAASLAFKLGVPNLPISADQLIEEVDRRSRTKRRYRDD